MRQRAKKRSAPSQPFGDTANRTLRRQHFVRGMVAIVRDVFCRERPETVTQWAESNRILAESGAESGRYRASRCPYQRAIMDAFNDPEVREISWMAGERLGKSTVAANVLGFTIDRAPCSVLWVMPSREAMADFLKDELEPMIAASPRLKAKVAAGQTSKGRTNNIRRKTFAGGVCTFVGGGSATAVAFHTVRVVVLDELDKLRPLSEGDADSLASKRVSTFGSDYKILRLSKPTEEGSSRIDRHYRRGTMSRYMLSCPGCHQEQELGWSLLDFETVKLRCVHCDEFFNQDIWLEQPGVWRETVKNPHHKSFALSALSRRSFVGQRSLRSIAPRSMCWKRAITL